MTLASTKSKAGPYIGDGNVRSFSYLFKILDKSHLYVIHTDEEGTETEVVSGLYSISGLGNEGGGTVTYPKTGPALPADEKITIYRAVPLTQLTDITTGGRFDPRVHEDVFDLLAMGLQQLEENISRAFLLNMSADSGTSAIFPVPEKSHLLGWNAAGTGLRNYDFPELTTIDLSSLDIEGATTNDILYFDGASVVYGNTIAGLTVTGGTLSNSTISGGTIDSAVIGATTPAAGTFSILYVFGNLETDGTITAGSANTVLTNANGTLRGAALESGIAGAGLDLTGGVLSVVGGGSIGVGDIDTTSSSTNDIIYNNGSAAVWGPVSSIGFDYSSDGVGVLPNANVADSLTIDGGTINNSVIGGSTPAVGTFTSVVSTGSVTASVQFHVSGVAPQVLLSETDAASDNKYWAMQANGEQLLFTVYNDALSTSQNWLEVERTGQAIDTVSFPDGVLVAGTSGTTLTNADGTIKGAAIESAIAGAGLVYTSGVLSVSGGGVVDVADITTGGSTNDVIYNNGGTAAWGTFNYGSWGTGVLPDVNVANNLTVDGGTINNSVIGATTPADGTFSDIVANGSVTASVRVNMFGTSPQFLMSETGATLDNKYWTMRAVGEQLKFAAYNDALTISNGWLEVERTGTSIDTVTFPDGVLVAGTSNTTLTNSNGTIKGSAIESAIAGTGLTYTSGVLSVSGGGSVDVSDINTGGSTNDVIYNNSGTAAWGTFNYSSWGTGVLPNSKVADNLTISNGTVNSTVIGGTTPAVGTFTTLNATGDILAPTGGLMVGITGLFNAAIRIHQSSSLGSSVDDTTLISNFSGISTNVVSNVRWLRRDASGSSWTTTRMHDAISVDVSFLTPGVDTKCWYERDPNSGLHEWGNAATTYMTLVSGQAKFENGTAAAPSITFNSDSNTGLYRVNDNELGITAGGSLRYHQTSSWADFSGCSSGVAIGTNDFLSLWGASETYGLGMASVSAHQYGPVTGYSIKLNMNSTAGRGITMGVQGSTPTHAFDTLNGNTQHKGWVRAGNGTTGAPSYAFYNDTNMGMYRVGNDTLGFVSASAARMTIHSGGSYIHTKLIVSNSPLEITGTTSYLSLPSLTTTQRNALSAWNGMMIYNNTTKVVEARENNAWVNL